VNDFADNRWHVYVDRRCDDGKPFYVGKGNDARLSRSVRNLRHTNVAKKHGFVREVVMTTPDENFALQKERELITEFHTRDYDGGCNYTAGGDGVSGLRHTQESKDKNRAAHVGKTLSKETCEKKSVSMKLSKKVYRRKVVKLSAGVVVDTYDSVADAARSVGDLRGATLVSRCCAGKTKTFAGFGWNYVDADQQTTVKKRQRAAVRRVLQSSLADEPVAQFASLAEASRTVKRNAGSIKECCHNRRETAYGFKWQFVDKSV